jgi:hypothetical protein
MKVMRFCKILSIVLLITAIQSTSAVNLRCTTWCADKGRRIGGYIGGFVCGTCGVLADGAVYVVDGVAYVVQTIHHSAKEPEKVVAIVQAPCSRLSQITTFLARNRSTIGSATIIAAGATGTYFIYRYGKNYIVNKIAAIRKADFDAGFEAGRLHTEAEHQRALAHELDLAEIARQHLAVVLSAPQRVALPEDDYLPAPRNDKQQKTDDLNTQQAVNGDDPSEPQ